MDGNFESNARKRNRALIIRCDDESFMELLDLIRQDSRWYLIYSKSSGLKLLVREGGF